MQRDLYRIDDVLLRAGCIATLLVALATAGVWVSGLAAGSAGGRADGLVALARHGPLLALAACCPAALLWTGFSWRRRERQIAAVWSLLRQNAVLSVPELLASSDFTRRDLERAVRFLNNRGLAHYIWDRKSDTIQDGRLESLHLAIDKCDACGGALALEIPVAAREIPRCPYCGDPVSLRSLEERRREAIEALRVASGPETRPAGGSGGSRRSFSLGLFVLLLIAFWPAALLYAFYQARSDGSR